MKWLHTLHLGPHCLLMISYAAFMFFLTKTTVAAVNANNNMYMFMDWA